MDAELAGMLGQQAAVADVYRPDIYRLPGDSPGLKALLAKNPDIRIHDRIHEQLRELVKSLNPQAPLKGEQLEEAVQGHLNGRSLTEYGVWVYYPWSRTLVHLLDEQEFAEVRTDRNRNKITREEQAVLSSKKVGVIGLSVGQSVSMAMALERSFGEIRLADFDTLDLSNLNRIRAGAHNLGLNKALITARAIAEIDPFLQVLCFTEGLTRGNMDAFFTGGGKLDMVVEECDSVDIKILARQKAKALGIPVVMDMSDRGCLDVERFDLEPGRPLMHGWIDHLDLDAAGRPMTAEEKVPYMLPITGMETLSARMKASVLELGQTISTWPQLATSVVLGGALAGDAVRRILLGEFHASGRWFVDLEELVADPPAPAPAPTNGAAASGAFTVKGTVLKELAAKLGPLPKDAVEPDSEEIGKLITAGGLAPSSGNMQPWRFAWHGKRLLLFHDHARSHSFWDPDHFIAHIGLGACVENVVLKAHELGLEVVSRLFPVEGNTALVAAFEFHRDAVKNAEPHVADDLAPMIAQRHTNRKFPHPGPLPAGAAERLAEVGRTMEGCRMHLLEDRAKLVQLADLCGQSERIRILNLTGHAEFFGHEIRWTAEEAERTRDGLDIATMEMRPTDLAGLQVASDPRAIELLNRWKGGKGLENVSAPAIKASSAAMLVTAQRDSLPDRIQASRLFQRLWMAANAIGLAVHPIAAPILLTHGLPLIKDQLGAHEREELEHIQQELDRLWDLHGRKPIFMARLAQAGEPSMRSYRHPLSAILLPTP